MEFLTQDFKSAALRSVQNEIASLIKQPFPVLIMGNPGSGKTSWALSLAKANGSYVVVECLQAPKTLKEWRALFTENQVQSFVFENMDRWTESTQNSLAHYLKEQVRFDKKVVSTSSFEIQGRLNKGQFRNDLFYRLCVRPVSLPTPEECREDLGSAAEFWLDVHSLVAGIQKPCLTPEALSKLQGVKWTGAWSEFITVLERAVSYGNGRIEPEHLIFPQVVQAVSALEAGLTLAEMEKKLILQTLKLTASNKSQAARLLGISIRTLRNKLNEYKQEGFHELV